MFFADDYLSAAIAIDASLARQVMAGTESEGRSLSALLLGVTDAANGAIIHVPHVLCHVEARADDRVQSARAEVVERHLCPLGATCALGPFGTVKVLWPLPAELPLVSIIIPTRDKVELLRACVDSLLGATLYRPFEILIVDNGSSAAETLDYLSEIAAHPAIRVLRYDEPYNYSAINNFAARAAAGSYLCLLNNDTEVVEPDWLTEMIRYAVRPDVGAVGAKLLYGDGSIQHAGVIVGIGEAAGHAHRFAPANQPGYFRQPHVAQFVSAVTAACLVVEKGKFEAVGGLDEKDLAIAYNDVDLCLKLEAAGWRNVYVPHAVLLHHESKSRGSDVSPEHVDRYMRELRIFQERWGTKTYDDPLHNPNLDRYSETFVIGL
jgi:GT2 family glycosyltransferase